MVFVIGCSGSNLHESYRSEKTVLVSMLVTIVGMIIPFIDYNLYTCLVAFALLGYGNTILQCVIEPVVDKRVKGNVLASSLTAGQVLKAVSSFCGPFIAAFAATVLGNWQYLFPIFALLTLISMGWLILVYIREEVPEQSTSSWGATFGLLKDRTILSAFFGNCICSWVWMSGLTRWLLNY